MYEELLEDIAQNNDLREINPYCKLIAGLGAIILCLVAVNFVAPLFIFLVITGAIIILARISVRTYAGLFIVPFTFAGLSVALIILITGGSEVFWSWNPLPWLSLSITRESINEGALVLCRVLGGTSALCFIALTTPMTDLFMVMRQCRVPAVVIELAMIIYRTIFILLDQLVQIYQAQVMRLGYTTRRESIQSFATLCGAVFIASWDAGVDLIRAMDARCYSGKYVVLGEIRPPEPAPVLAVAAFFIASSAIIAISGNISVI
jgi:cobalt/nickel transport system permease protein